MGATSVTGVGQGSVEGVHAGPKHWTVNADRVLGPRIVACGTVTLAGGTANVVLPLLGGVVGDYAVLVNTNNTTAAATSATLTFNENDTTVTVKGSGTNTVWWAIVKQGIALLNLS